MTTEFSIAGSVERRLEVIQQWVVLPDYATVNVSEPGWEQLARWLLAREVGVEAGVWSTSDALALIESGLSREFDRILVEPISPPVNIALAIVDEIHVTLDQGGVEVPRLQHTEDDSGWLIVADALRRGIQTRVGLEDLLLLPDGSHPVNNAELVAAALQLTA